MALNYQQLKTELQTDPLALGYAPLLAAGNQSAIADLLNEPINLTGATVRVRWTIDGGSPVQKDMTIVDAASGRVQYQFGAGELAIVSGEKSAMRLNVVVTDGGGKVLTQSTPTTYTIRKKI